MGSPRLAKIQMTSYMRAIEELGTSEAAVLNVRLP